MIQVKHSFCLSGLRSWKPLRAPRGTPSFLDGLCFDEVRTTYFQKHLFLSRDLMHSLPEDLPPSQVFADLFTGSGRGNSKSEALVSRMKFPRRFSCRTVIAADDELTINRVQAQTLSQRRCVCLVNRPTSGVSFLEMPTNR